MNGKRPAAATKPAADIAYLKKRRNTPLKRTSKRFGGLSLPADIFAPEGLEEALRGIILNIAQTSNATGQCKLKYHKTYCGCGYKVHAKGCRKKDCPECAELNGRRRGRAVRRKLEPLLYGDEKQPRHMGYLVVTIPPALRVQFSDKKRWRAFVRKVWKLIKTKYNGDFAVECTHIYGDCPDGVQPEEWERLRVFHPHLNFLWCATKGHRPYLDYQKFRADLRSILGTYETPVFHNRYFVKIKQVRQKIRYVVRTFPGFSAWLGPVRWFGNYPRGAAADPFKGKCSKCGQDLHFFGRSNIFEYEEYQSNSTGDPDDGGERAGPDWDAIMKTVLARYALCNHNENEG